MVSAYEAGTRIETVQGRTGTLDGTVDPNDNPNVQFDTGEFGALPPRDIKGTIDRFGAIHRFDDTRQAYDLAQCRDEIKDGDVLWVPSRGIADVLYQAWPIAVNEPENAQHGEFHGWKKGIDDLAAVEGGRCAASVRRARSLLARHGPATQPGQLSDPSWPQPVHGSIAAAAHRPPRQASAAATPPWPCPGSTPGR